MAAPREFESLHAAIKEAGEVLMEYFGRQIERTYKTTASDFVARMSTLGDAAIVGAGDDEFLLSNGTSIHEFLVDRVTRPLSSVGREIE